jgi:hypothetical protein
VDVGVGVGVGVGAVGEHRAAEGAPRAGAELAVRNQRTNRVQGAHPQLLVVAARIVQPLSRVQRTRAGRLLPFRPDDRAVHLQTQQQTPQDRRGG